MKSAEWANTKTKANMKLQFCRIFIAVSNLVTALCAAEIAARKIQSVAPNASGPQMPIYNVCAVAAEAHACGRTRGPFAPRANGNTEKATLVRRLSRARSRGGSGEIAWESTAGSGPAPSRRPIYLRHSQSPLCLPLRLQQFVIDGRRPRDVSDVSHYIQGDRENLARTREREKSTDKCVNGCRGGWFSW